MHGFLRNTLLFYIRFWAKKALKKHRPLVIGVAGSVGKSSTCQAILAVLKASEKVKLIKGNSETGIPLGLLGIETKSLGYETVSKSIVDWLRILVKAPFSTGYIKGSKYLIIEMGIDDPNPPKNMGYLLSIVKPDIALSLNIAPPHLGQFEKILKGKVVENKLDYVLDRMADEDTKIISKSGCSIGIYNADDKRISKLIEKFGKSKTKTRLLTFGQEKSNTVSYSSYDVSLESSDFSFLLNSGEKKQSVTLHFTGFVLPSVYREVIAAVIIVGLQTGLTLQSIKSSLEKNYRLPKGRSSILEGVKNSIIIDSSYNASPVSVKAFLDLLQKLKTLTNRPSVFIFGDMRELGSSAKEEHEKIAAEIAKQVDYLYCVGPMTREYFVQQVEGYNKDLKEIRWFDSAIRAGEYLKDHLPENSIVLAKGSQNTIFLEEAVKLILKNPADSKNLCRQEDYWLRKKRDFVQVKKGAE